MMNGRVRAWHTKQEVMYSPETMAADQLTLMPDGSGFINVSSTHTKLSQVYPHMIPMYSTGVYDVNGREIFDGDHIILMSQYMPKSSLPGTYHKTVEWNEKDCGWNITQTQPNHAGYKVLGNKYQGIIYDN